MTSARREEILTSADSARWDAVLDRIGTFDFCHLARYSHLAELSGQGEARMLVLREGAHVIAFPLLVREIGAPALLARDGGWRDVTSVYGYAGPIATSDGLPEAMRQHFCAFTAAFLREQRVVAAFARLHPLLDQAPLLAGCGEIVPAGWTLAVDLTAPEEEQRQAYRRNHRQDIKRLTALGVRCEQVGLERLDDFISMYYETMNHVCADPDYYYGRSYFEYLLGELPGVSHLFMCFDGEAPVAGGIFTICRGFVQWYLSGSRHDYAGPPPAKLLFDVARRWAITQGGRLLHLGGGVGGQQDSLYHFKRGFTHDEYVYSTWRCVANPEAYREITRAVCRHAGVEPPDDFFPAYRHPLLVRGRPPFASGPAIPVSSTGAVEGRS